ncbi:hypothetical protein PFICI_13071 [Pestalotiopsis fici W106-1]|uniref:Amidase domain-containing protein n=1 Tax=Pestalotiopsis fici (strain W106-1 / CGMCC3.15140) TaxID=1229662 RepID=W3WN43_PESFW|nr:uncharacterized protein PFICI_13071 [Pestalotiopsis fici W106-1]ETS74587.1 hypothetical protein PFICI_13071 [Pestalotiopsis fici W106-1]
MSNPSIAPKVLVTGTTGLIGTPIALEIANAGFPIRGTSRSQDRAAAWSAKYYHVKIDWIIIKDHAASTHETYKEAIKGCGAVVHVAGPYTLQHAKGEDIMIPQTQGVEAILHACSKELSVKRLVYTSTVAAINNDPHLGIDIKKVYSEHDWNPTTWEKGASATGQHMAVTSYCCGKTLAEKRAWEFMSEEKPHFDLVALCPGTVYGRPMQVLNGVQDLDAAHARLWHHITHALEVVPGDPSPVFTNIFDLAEAHLKALTWPKCSGQRYMIVSGSYSYARIFALFRNLFPEQAQRFPVIPNDGLPLEPSFVNDCSKAEKELGMRWRTLDETVLEAGRALLEGGKLLQLRGELGTLYNVTMALFQKCCQSKLRKEDVHRLAASLSVEIDIDDANDYLILLQSLESVSNRIIDAPEYVEPALRAQPVVGNRNYWKPARENNPMNAWSHRCELESSQPSNDLLRGRTLAIKDNISVGGLPTTLGTFDKVLSPDGSPPAISPIDASVVSRILSAGGVIKGSSTCENHCASPLSFTSATGPVHHPLLHGYTSGGSSSGSSALVAACELMRRGAVVNLGEVAELAIGSDQAGSVRIPASFTGIYGLKPTFGLVPYTGASSMSPMIDHLGPLASNLEDLATLLKVMAGYDGLDPRTTPESPLLEDVKDYPKLLSDFRDELAEASVGSSRRMKVGFLVESFQIPGLAPNVRDAVRLAAEHFRAAGADVTDVSVPLHLDGPIIWAAATRPSMSDFLCQGKTGGHLTFLPPHIQPQWPPKQEAFDLLSASNPALVNIMLSGQFAHSHFGTSLEAKAHRMVFELRAAYDEALKDVDVLVTPCAPTVAVPHPEPGDRGLRRLNSIIGVTNNTCPFNITGHPAMSVPCGTASNPEHPDVQLPIGMQIVGRRWQDETVFMAAALFEQGVEASNQDK